MEYLPKCDLVVSATASPNFTLREELFADITLEKPLILIDLAVPRDIEPKLGEHAEITLYDMDSFRLKETPKGLPFREWFYYLRKNYNLLTAALYSVIPYLRILIGR